MSCDVCAGMNSRLLNSVEWTAPAQALWQCVCQFLWAAAHRERSALKRMDKSLLLMRGFKVF